MAASTDPMIVLARKLDPMRREFIKWTEHNVESVEQKAGEQLGKARFAAYGKTMYPDATFTLRLSYGQVKGYPMNGTEAPSQDDPVTACTTARPASISRGRSICPRATRKDAPSWTLPRR